jgi:quercetin dioxygenase-like cupin family protein
MIHTAPPAYSKLLSEMARLFCAEDTPDAIQTAKVLRAAAKDPPPPPAQPFRLDARIRTILRQATHPVSVLIRDALPLLQWEATSILDAQIPGDVSQVFAVVALIGPGGLIDHPRLRAGLFVQVENAYYPLHCHAAAETYILLQGHADWTAGKTTASFGPGAVIHHPPFIPHALRTRDQPVVALWRWGGDISVESYSMLPDPET